MYRRDERSPVISVLMPVYNAERYMAVAIESILNQALTGFELIIVDDGSTDATLRILQSFAQKDQRIVVLKNRKNLGICRSLNRGIRLARGAYIARMDADDWSYPQRLQQQVALMQAYPKIVVCGGQIEVCDKNLKTLNKREYPQKDNEIRARIFRLNPFAHPAVMMRTQAVKKAGGYNPSLAGAEDYDLYFRLGRLGRFANLPQTLLKLRIHPTSVSANTIAHQTKLNLYVRVKAATEYGYRLNRCDQVFFVLNLLALKLVPDRFKFGAYNLFRNVWSGFGRKN